MRYRLIAFSVLFTLLLGLTVVAAQEEITTEEIVAACKTLSSDECELNKGKCWLSTCGCLSLGEICDQEPCEELAENECATAYSNYCWWSEDCDCLPTSQACEIGVEGVDLKVEEIDYTLDDAENPTKISFFVKIVNIGDDTSPFFDVNVQVPQLSVFQKNTCMYKNLGPGEGCTETGYGYLSDGSSLMTVAPIQIIAIADPRDEIKELNEHNNKLGIITLEGPDICADCGVGIAEPVPEPIEVPIAITSEECPVGCQCSDEMIICETIPMESHIGCQMGCLLNNRCIIQGTRTTLENKSSYCGIDGTWKLQKVNDGSCENNYECKTNFCSSGACYDIVGEIEETKSILEKILDFFGNLFK